MRTRHLNPTLALAVLGLQAALATPAYAGGAVFYDGQTEAGWSTSQQRNIEGMAWGYYHTGPLTQSLSISPGDPVAIQLYDADADEWGVGGSDDELQLWRSDTTLTANAGESVRFEFFAVVPSDRRQSASETYEKGLEINARFSAAPGTFASQWNSTSWSSSGRTFDDRAASFDGYPAADHVVRLYYVHPGAGFGGVTPGGRTIETIVESGNKKIWATAQIGESMISSSTNENKWDNAFPKGMTGTVIVSNTSDREDLVVNLDFLELWDEDDTSADDLLVEVESKSPGDFNLGPGGTLKWVVKAEPEWAPIEEARDYFAFGEGDLDPYGVFSVNGDPDLPVEIVADDALTAYLEDQPETTFSFGAVDSTSALPPPPLVEFSGAAASYTVDQDVAITCTVTDMGGGIAYDTCSDVSAPAWSFEAGTTTYEASAFDLYGQEGSDSVSFEVTVTPDSLIAITERFVDHAGIENSLVKKIEAAAKAKTATAQDAACEAFVHEVEAQAGNHVSEFYAEILIYWAEELKLQ